MSPLIHVVLWQVVDELVKLASVFLCKLRKKFDFSWHEPPLNLAVRTIPSCRSCTPLASCVCKFLTDDMIAIPVTGVVFMRDRRSILLAMIHPVSEPGGKDAGPCGWWFLPNRDEEASQQ